MKVLVIGSGSREHALVLALSRDPQVDAVIAAPGNPGIAAIAHTEAVDMNDAAAVTALAETLDVDLVVIGPEAPLVAGVADALRESSFPVFGPSSEAAVLEGSKAFAKEIMESANVPTARAVVAYTPDEAAAALDDFGAPYVVKADGLAAGKGVVVTSDRAEALTHASSCLEVSDRVVIEDYLDGPEVSLFVLCDGQHTLPLAPAQDFKRIGDGDTGPNTGGMGAYSPLLWIPAGTVDDIVTTVAQPVVDEMTRRGTPFVGLLYCGLALTSKGMRVVEFNVRFGDPETQSVLARLRSPLGQTMLAAAEGRLDEVGDLDWDPRTSVTVVMAAENYPSTPRTGDIIRGLNTADDLDDVHILHAGTARATDTGAGFAPEDTVISEDVAETGDIVTAGGRVLSVVSLGDGLDEARAKAYAAVDEVKWDGEQHRTDIAEVAARGQITVADIYPAPAEPVAAPTATGLDSQAPELPGWTHVYSGKVRDLYIPDTAADAASAEQLLMVASDRISAYDWVLDSEIPDKGRVLTGLSLWWFDQLSDVIGNHVISSDVPQAVAGRGLIVKNLSMLPIECVARGYLTGSGMADYKATGSVCGIQLPAGLIEADRLEPAIFTPATKAELGDHDENVSFAQITETIGAEAAEQARDLTIEIYQRAEAIARERGIILADTKFEFGTLPDGTMVLGDEVLTPDSSRFWDAESYEAGQAQASFDKQFVRDWLTKESGWDKSSDTPPPALPAEVVEKTRARYIEAFEKLTGQKFPA
ncbi:MAG: phosphoribosylamine--glycine ligase [Brevibacterium aurantiacum]|uniref:Multifunctional fusion protein n=3 Tax=Brevibacterium aurantiacum TaxID=273384 RepID=A0A2H1HXH7_BREAU|nr:phosphoribosylamine--glycine ligase [Brevibacterium aurantiacum]AZL04749.1 phosphoribosylamine--glycine ligase [Brevibacterium aurantiacum]AZT96165.1 phosphoribosylamine--glycine ligase [Brevibacterium aurantiacum]MDN6377459.1 phosphoribosylamine--glycine ligase [Brevibacterium aurantiacum]PCC53191.1 phosphoribosylamine--glycine ligase [Brevibacterium aurantiacum]RCS90533.1 phosphoribosylamine--glycine ligase [Brevibacterium aurantiacum]